MTGRYNYDENKWSWMFWNNHHFGLVWFSFLIPATSNLPRPTWKIYQVDSFNLADHTDPGGECQDPEPSGSLWLKGLLACNHCATRISLDCSLCDWKLVVRSRTLDVNQPDYLIHCTETSWGGDSQRQQSTSSLYWLQLSTELLFCSLQRINHW